MFPLPPPDQARFTQWFQKTIPETDEIIIYPGEQLTCSTRSRLLKTTIRPKHVFITQDKEGHFKHKLLGNDNKFTPLPKRLYSVCFPKVHVSAVPTNNRITIPISDSRQLTLPFIPDEFYKQKIAKAERHTNPGQRRTKRRRTTQAAQPTQNYAGWSSLLANRSANAPSKYVVLRRLRGILDMLDERNVVPSNPFDGCDESLNGCEDKLATVVQFIYHYARGEMRMTNLQSTPADDIWELLIDTLTAAH